jgi:DNA-directed RNA polymerase
MRSILAADLSKRKRTELDKRSKVYILNNYTEEELLDVAIPILHGFLRTMKDGQDVIPFTELACAIGRAVLNLTRHEQDSALACRIGAFILYTFEKEGLIARISAIGRIQSQKHVTHAFEITNREALTKLFLSVDVVKRNTFPRPEPFPDWTSFINKEGQPLVHSYCKSLVSKLTPKTHPLVFNAVNKMQRKGWAVNQEVLRHVEWALKGKADVFLDVYQQKDPLAKKQKLYEIREVLRIAESMRYWPAFYNRYYYDFRGRMYNASAFFNEQGGDLARGLLLRSVRVPIQAKGLFWLYVVLATTWGGSCGREDGRKSDKIPIHDRYEWAKSKEAEFLDCANDPRQHQLWMKADAPWQFLAAAIELKKYFNWKVLNKSSIESGEIGEFDYNTSFQGFFDGTNNGSQHLCALTRDDMTAHHVNLVKSEYPGDLYLFGAESVWKTLDDRVESINEHDMDELEAFSEEYAEMREELSRHERNSQGQAEILSAMKELRVEKKESLSLRDVLFWQAFRDSKDRRKIVKRGIMTIPYGATPYGMGDQVHTDSKKHGIEKLHGISRSQAAFMGNLLYNTCMQNMPRAMKLMKAFEAAGLKAEEENRMLSWSVPITRFPVVQHYVEGEVKAVDVKYGPKPEGEVVASGGRSSNTLQLNVCFFENSIISKRKQALGAAPNIVHSLDAAHLCLTVNRCDFDITTIHDSYGALLPDMDALFRIVRETFVELYTNNPLDILAAELNLDLSEIDLGSLDINQVLDSEYAFS